MNAKHNFSDFTLDVVLKNISQVAIEGTSDKRINIALACEVDDAGKIREYEHVMKFLEQKGITKGVKNKNEGGYIEDDDSIEHEMLFYEPSFILNQKELRNFRVSTSRIPKYSLSMDIKRRVIINDKYILSTPQFDSENFYFIDHCIKQTKGIITRGCLGTKPSGEKRVVKRFYTVLENLRFSPDLKDVFFPNVSEDAVQFRSHVTVKELLESEVDLKKTDAFMDKLPKLSRKPS